MTPRSKAIAAALAVVGTIAVAGGVIAAGRDDGGTPHPIAPGGAQPEERPVLAMMTSLPIYWGGASSIEQLLAGGPVRDEGGDAHGDSHSHEAEANARHWVRQALEERFDLLPLDVLGQPDGSVAQQLVDVPFLLLAQPYTLTPVDNAALDSWVRGGGRLLFFADPVLTEHSPFPLGDRRRPQDVGLVPPIFAHWGLEQTFDETQDSGPVSIGWAGTTIPTDQRGAFRYSASGSEAAQCSVEAEGLVVRCTVGKGSALLVADAALLEPHALEGAHEAFVELTNESFPSR